MNSANPKSKIQNPKSYDAVVVGSGPNGMAAAITLARAGRSVLVVEARDTVGGGMRSAELTLPGFTHDVCSAIHPMGTGSPFFRDLPLREHGLQWIHTPTPFAHPMDDGTAVTLEHSLRATAEGLGRDGAAYRRLIGPLARHWSKIEKGILGPFALPRHPLVLANFGVRALLPARFLFGAVFKTERARALLAGAAAHSMLDLNRPPSAAMGLVLATLGHVYGWPLARGGSQSLADALASYLRSLGGEIVTGCPVEDIDVLPPARRLLFDVTPRQLVKIVGGHLPDRYRSALGRYRYGPGVFKVDYALDGPVPWRAAECARASTVHLGGTMDEIAESEGAVWRGRHPERPYLLVTQSSLFDPTRAPAGKHTLWAYCHVPSGSDFDMTERIEAQFERFAPGFRDRILARHVMSPGAVEEYNPNYVGGDINGGVQDLLQLFTRPLPRRVPYSTPNPRIFLCSSSTPPGGGVHGMCGYHAARAAMRGM